MACDTTKEEVSLKMVCPMLYTLIFLSLSVMGFTIAKKRGVTPELYLITIALINTVLFIASYSVMVNAIGCLFGVGFSVLNLASAYHAMRNT